MYPLLESDQTIVIEERWKGLLWSAVPHRVVSSDTANLVTYVPAGTASVVGSNRDEPGCAELTRSERKLKALQTLRVSPLQINETPHKLYFYSVGRWARVNLGWDPTDGRFMGWYVNFERPAVATEQGLVSKDLVLDMYIEPEGTWQWKDRDDLDVAIREGVFDQDLKEILDDEAQRVLSDHEAQSGAFEPKWRQFRARETWAAPVLPSSYLPDGDLWRQ